MEQPRFDSITTTKTIGSRKGNRRKTWRRLWATLCAVIALGVAFSGNGGMINPEYWAFPSIVAMTFPAWVIANFFLAIINAIFFRRLLLINLAALILTLEPTWAFCPLNFGNKALSESEEAEALHFMTYNTYGFVDDEGIYPNGTNRTASAIINSGADIVCLQETGKIMSNKSRRLKEQQVDSIYKVYPYSASNNYKHTIILSKYPLREIILNQPSSPYAGFKAAEVDFKGEKLLVVSIHLESIGLSSKDKYIYESMTDGADTKEWVSGGRTIYRKLKHAFRQRARQAKLLRSQLDSLNYKNVIVAGDFNDIADCYAIRVIEGGKMHSVFTRCGLGPRITYHNNRFYFNIDHILYEGNLRAIETHRGTVGSSDHYPVYCTFTLEK